MNASDFGIIRASQRLWDRYQSWRYGTIDPDAKLGVRGEQAAARLLRKKGLVVVAHSESDRGGEIDLIAIDRRKQVIIFVEVKTLATTKPGHPADRVDEAKQAQITRAALRYLRRQKMLNVRSRFDVVAVWWVGDTPQPQRIEHYESAFEATGVNGFYS
jgi:putative endonuclease